MDALGTEEGARCWRDGCEGVIEVHAVEGCACHINPPCGACTKPREFCDVCGWEAIEEERAIARRDYAIRIDVADWLVSWSKPRPRDPRKIDWNDKPHSGCSMIKEGVYPEGTTATQVLDAIGRGTFGGRFEHFGGGKFKYIAYTD